MPLSLTALPCSQSNCFDLSPGRQESVGTKNCGSEASQPGFESYFHLLAVSPSASTVPSVSSFENMGNKNTIHFAGLLRGLSKFVHGPCLEENLAREKPSENVA